jgi:hypothetical protein
MRTLRLLLTLMLCLAVPTAGWASVMSGPLCPRLHHHQETSEHVAQHEHADHGADHCGDVSTHGKPCKGDHCDCGCGTGACSSSAMPLLAMQDTSLPYLADKGHLPQDRDAAVSAVRGSSPLRPPIS